MPPAVAFEQVVVERGAIRALDGVSFETARGETLVLLGRSGSGKTTALKLINALLRPSSGSVKVSGAPASDDVVGSRRRIGYVIQEGGLLPHWSVGRNVGLAPEILGWARPRIETRVEEMLELVGLPAAEFRRRWPHELSGGQRQRVGIARALAAEPELLLFDEPFGALDPITRRELQDEFLRLRERLRTTAIFVTHDVGEALRIATRIAVLDRGRLDFLGSPAEFRQVRVGEAAAFLRSLPA